MDKHNNALTLSFSRILCVCAYYIVFMFLCIKVICMAKAKIIKIVKEVCRVRSQTFMLWDHNSILRISLSLSNPFFIVSSLIGFNFFPYTIIKRSNNAINIITKNRSQICQWCSVIGTLSLKKDRNQKRKNEN